MRTNEPRFVIVESREGAQLLEEGAEIPPSLIVVMLVDESKFDWDQDGLTEDAVVITVRSSSRTTAFRDLRKQASDELGIAIGPLTVKRLGGEEIGTASKLGLL